MQQRPGQGERIALALQRQLRQRRPPGVAQTQQLGGFVKGLARGVVYGLAQQSVAAYAINTHQLRVAARYQQRDIGRFWRIGG